MVVFVSAFIKSDSIRRPIEQFFSHFYILAKSGIEILLFLDERFKSSPEETIIQQFPNVKIVEYISLDTSWYPTNINEIKLPVHRNTQKDTLQYLSIQLMKMKLVNDAIKYTNDDYLAWIDFSIFHMITDIKLAYQKINQIANTNDFIKTHIISPSPNNKTTYINLFDSPIWYFAGCFFLGHKSLFNKVYEHQMEIVKKNLPLITWEVNYWFMMRDFFQIYKGDHNDSILDI